MCGRYAVTLPPEAMASLFRATGRPNLAPRWNVAPTQDAPVIAVSPEGERRLALYRWGLVPVWAKALSGSSPVINARAETAAEKPMFRHGLAKRRIVVPADGFYEWRADADGKTPFFIRRRDGEPLVFAGLAEAWRPPGAAPEAPPLLSFAILTVPGGPDLAELHDRSPAILFGPDAWDAWLTPGPAPMDMIAPPPPGTLEAYKVSRAVNAVRNDGPDLITPVAGRVD